MALELPHPLRFTPGALLKSAGEIIRQDGTTIDAALTKLEDSLLKQSPVPPEILSPRSIENLTRPPVSLRRRYAREGLRTLQESIDLLERHENELLAPLQLRLTELRILREKAVRRLAEMTRFGR